MKTDEFRAHGHALIDWIADYLESIRDYPVKSQVEPGQVLAQLPARAPAEGERFETIFEDFQNIILPGVTHWQHPRFFAYFPANSSPPSLLAEMLMSAMGAQCMSWQTSPAATELEERVMSWLRDMLGLPKGWAGVIQDTASTATLCSILTAREQASLGTVNRRGLAGSGRLVVYCSSEAHSSVEKAVRIAGLGSDNLTKIDVDESFAMRPQALIRAIRSDREQGAHPLCVVATLGTTGSTAVDPLRHIGEICEELDIWLHVDAAYSGTALLLPEMRWMSDGIEYADSFVFNPHKWLFTNFDCSAYFVRNREALISTFEILPEYLKTHEGSSVNNYRDWGIQLGRRFRALKLWFVIRSYGVDGLKAKINRHIQLAGRLETQIAESGDFELLAPRMVNLLCFRYHPPNLDDEASLGNLNQRLLEELNSSGRVYLTHTKLNGVFALRLVAGQTRVTATDVEEAWDLIRETARRLAVP